MRVATRWCLGMLTLSAVFLSAAGHRLGAAPPPLRGGHSSWNTLSAGTGRAADRPAAPRGRVEPGEWIFFVRKQVTAQTPLGDIYAIRPDGSGLRRITDFAAALYSCDFPELAPDGRRLVFISNYKPWLSAFYKDAFIMDLATGDFRRVTGDERPLPADRFGTLKMTIVYPEDEVFSPKSARVSFKGCHTFVHLEEPGELQVTGGEKIWVKAEIRSGIGCVREVHVPVGGREVIVMDLREGTLEACYADLAPDGRRLAVSTCVAGKNPYWSVSLWDVASGVPLAANPGGPVKEGGDGGATFSPDGRWIAYCPGTPAKTSLGLLPSSEPSVAPTILYKTPLLGADMCLGPAWAPDSRRLLFLYGTTDMTTYAQFNLYCTDIDGAPPAALTAFEGGRTWAGKAAYSPDGARIVFTLARANGTGGIAEDLYIMPAEGGAPVPLTEDGVSLNPCWGIVRGDR